MKKLLLLLIIPLLSFGQKNKITYSETKKVTYNETKYHLIQLKAENNPKLDNWNKLAQMLKNETELIMNLVDSIRYTYCNESSKEVFPIHILKKGIINYTTFVMSIDIFAYEDNIIHFTESLKEKDFSDYAEFPKIAICTFMNQNKLDIINAESLMLDLIQGQHIEK